MATIHKCDKCHSEMESPNDFTWYENENKDYTDRFGRVSIELCNVCMKVILNFTKQFMGYT